MEGLFIFVYKWRSSVRVSPRSRRLNMARRREPLLIRSANCCIGNEDILRSHLTFFVLLSSSFRHSRNALRWRCVIIAVTMACSSLTTIITPYYHLAYAPPSALTRHVFFL